MVPLLAAGLLQSQTVLPLWTNLQKSSTTVEHDTTTDKDPLIAGKRVARLTDVSAPTLTFYPAPKGGHPHAAVAVFPGGGNRILAYDLEGTEVCEWLNSIDVACALIKYRVPDAGPFPKHPEDLADAQRAVRMIRQHASEWSIDSKRVGVLGFSAGGHLSAVLDAHTSDNVYPHTDAADALSARPDFAILIYPGGIVHPPDLTDLGDEVKPTAETPPTIVVQAEDDPVHVENTTVYFAALKQSKIPAEMHVYAQGGHGYGLRPTALPVTHWPQLAEEWLRTIRMMP